MRVSTHMPARRCPLFPECWIGISRCLAACTGVSFSAKKKHIQTIIRFGRKPAEHRQLQNPYFEFVVLDVALEDLRPREHAVSVLGAKPWRDARQCACVGVAAATRE